MADLAELLRQECGAVSHFGEILGDILSERGITQTQFAQIAYYSEPVVSRLINGSSQARPPRWMDYTEIARLTQLLQLNQLQLAKLTAAYICDTLRSKGIIQ